MKPSNVFENGGNALENLDVDHRNDSLGNITSELAIAKSTF